MSDIRQTKTTFYFKMISILENYWEEPGIWSIKRKQNSENEESSKKKKH